MLKPNEAFAKAFKLFPELDYTGDCVSYKNCWVFPYKEGNLGFGGRIFVSQKHGGVISNDPSFDVELWNKSENHKDEIDIEKMLRLGKIIGNSSLKHHGILGQKWGKRNGPPYPLSGGQYTATEQKKIKAARKNKYSRYNKKHYDQVVKKGSKFSTLSYNPNRTDKTDMFYAVSDKLDAHHYNSFFNEKIPQPIYNENGENIGTGKFYKYTIENKAVKDVKVASEDSGIKAFSKLYQTDRDFYNYVTDPERMEKRFTEGVHKFRPGYANAEKALNNMQRKNYTPTDKDLAMAYRLFNHAIPSGANGDAKKAKDVATQRAKFFNELKKEGYGAVLDTNDALYNTVQSRTPVIVFDMESVVKSKVRRNTTKDVAVSKAINVGRHLLLK